MCIGYLWKILEKWTSNRLRQKFLEPLLPHHFILQPLPPHCLILHHLLTVLQLQLLHFSFYCFVAVCVVICFLTLSLHVINWLPDNINVMKQMLTPHPPLQLLSFRPFPPTNPSAMRQQSDIGLTPPHPLPPYTHNSSRRRTVTPAHTHCIYLSSAPCATSPLPLLTQHRIPLPPLIQPFLPLHHHPSPLPTHLPSSTFSLFWFLLSLF